MWEGERAWECVCLSVNTHGSVRETVCMSVCVCESESQITKLCVTAVLTLSMLIRISEADF